MDWIFNMNWIKKYASQVLLIATIIILIIQNIQKGNEKVDDVIIPSTIVVKNSTHYDFEKITKLIVHKTFGYDTILVEYHYMPPTFESSPADRWFLRGYIIKNIIYDNSYLIFVSRNLPDIDHMEFLCHELYHLYQFQSGRLIPLDLIGTRVEYDGVMIDGYLVPYELRPHENDAFSNQNKVFLSIKKYIYK